MSTKRPIRRPGGLCWPLCSDPMPSKHLRDALAYLDGLRLLIAAERSGTLADPSAIEREIARAEASVRSVLSMIVDEVQRDHDSKPECETG